MTGAGGRWALAGLALLAVGGLLEARAGGAAAAGGALLLAPGLLVLAHGWGRKSFLAAGVAALGATAWAWSRARLGADAAVAGLAAQAAGMLLPYCWFESNREEDAAFSARRGPLAAERGALREALKELTGRVQSVERRGRETDALFHAAREISKLLTLADTLEFAREVLHDTLRQSLAEGAPAFVLALADAEQGTFRIGISEGLDDFQARALEEGGLDGPFCRWLGGCGLGVTVPSVAADPGLKGCPLPAGVRSLLCLPLLIQEQAIGWMVALDSGDGALASMDTANLRILCSQVAIGVEKATLYDRLQRLSITDGLTGLTVHRHFQARLDEELKRSERYHEPLSLVMSDIDHFKHFNDTWGHLAGDAVLKAVAGAMGRDLAPSEMAVRYGGEEFVLVLPRHTKEMALARAEALRGAVKALRVAVDGRELSVTISLGVASYPEDAMTKVGLIDQADGALYRSKAGGRDRVTAAGPPSA